MGPSHVATRGPLRNASLLLTFLALSCVDQDLTLTEVAGTTQPLYVNTPTLWPAGPISVCFTQPGFAKERGWLRTAIEQSWERETGVRFSGWGDCGTDTDGISIAFTKNDPDNVGTWSQYGTNARGVRPSMQYKLFDDGTNIADIYTELGLRSTGLHEFGHALGFIHEHERPDTPATCFARAPVSDPAFATVGPYDGDSVMNYCHPGQGLFLSATDIAGGRQYYGEPSSPQAAPQFKRTVVMIYGQTQPGQDMFIRGGIDHAVSQRLRGISCTNGDGTPNYKCALPIAHAQLRNATTALWKQQDALLDWYGPEYWQSTNGAGVAAAGTPLDWTTNDWPSSWGAARSVAVDGYGVTPLNTYGAHYWLLDVQMDCTKGYVAADGTSWFEVKSFISNGPGWEPHVSQAGTPYASINHVAKCGMINVFRRGDSSAQFVSF